MKNREDVLVGPPPHVSSDLSGGIYKILNLRNLKTYYGSTKDFDERRRSHFFDLKNNRHPNFHLQRAYNLEPGVFEFVIIQRLQESNLLIEEQKLLDLYWDNCQNCYNIARHANSPSLTDSVRQKISNSLKGHFVSEETRRKISLSNMGKKQSKGKLSPSYGKRHTQEARQKISNSLKGKGLGKILSKETRKKLSDSHKGKPAHNKGVPCSEEQKKKISQTLKSKITEDFLKEISERNSKIINVTFISSFGEKIFVYKNLNNFAKNMNLNITGVRRLVLKKINVYKGWRIDEQ